MGCKIIESSFDVQIGDPGSGAEARPLGGGALMDVGIYALQASPLHLR